MSFAKNLDKARQKYPGLITEILPARIPEELRLRKQWVAWRWQSRDDQLTKPPFQPDGKSARVNDPATWHDFNDIQAAYKDAQFDGVGFVLTETDPYCGIDLDKCRDPQTGHIEAWAFIMLKCLNSYSEVTPSGTGLRIIIKANLPDAGRKRDKLEMYGRLRFLTMTGHRLPMMPENIGHRQDELMAVHEYHFAAESPPVQINKPVKSKWDSLSDEALLEKARSAKNGERFARLWAGEWQTHYPSQSEADFALCSLLMFWTGGNVERVDRLFRASGLHRAKWDQARGGKGRTYGEKTIHKVLNNKPGG